MHTNGQSFGNLKTVWVQNLGDTVVLDSMWVIPGSVELISESMPFTYDEQKRALYIFPNEAVDSVQVRYRIIGIKDPLFMQTKSTSLINPYMGFDDKPLFYSPVLPSSNNELIDVVGLEKSGNIARGILVGTNRNLSVNSNLNLQLSGSLSPEIQVLASITDNNIPIQPEGNTQQLQDFDRIFIQLYNDDFKLIAGDYQLASPKSHFLTYFKKNLGLSFEGVQSLKNASTMNVHASMAMSKGRFARNVLIGQEGLQGPYRLTGAEGETFIIILSGTERVFMDGVLLKRGAEQDYTIDYNTAEVIFTPRVLITKDKRITVEFQYSERNYFRTMLGAGAEFTWKANRMYTHIYSEQDAKNQQQQQVLTDEEKQILEQVGNKLDEAVVHAIDSTGFDENRVMYALIDSLGYDSVFVVSTDVESAVYQLRFSDVGPGNGFYQQGPFEANGRTFVWVAPDTVDGSILLKGSFEPVRQLVAPGSHQMWVTGVDFKPRKGLQITGEAALTRLDPNTFSSIDNEANNSGALTTKVTQKIAMGSNSNLEITGGYEYLHRRFKPIERFRSVEFLRDWNLLSIGDSLLQHEIKSGIVWNHQQDANLGYSFSSLILQDYYTGQKHGFQANVKREKLQVDYRGSLLVSDLDLLSKTFYRHKTSLNYQLKPFTIGYVDEYESNKQRLPEGELDSLYKFYDWRGVIKSNPDKINTWELYGGKRFDYRAPNGEEVLESDATNLGASYAFLNHKTHRFQLGINYRNVVLADSSEINALPEESLTGRVEYGIRAAKGAVQWNIFYQFGSGLEQQREYFYQEVNQGLGVYEWIDLNEDGVRDLNEFFIATNPAFANYIRVFTPNNNFIRVIGTQFSQNLALNPSLIWNTKTGWKKWISRISSQTQFNIIKSTASENAVEAYNPFYNPSLDSALQSYTNTIRNTLFYNRAFSRFSLEYTFNLNEVKNLLLNGFQSTGIQAHILNIRWNINTVYSILAGYENGYDFSASDFLDSGNFRIDFQSIEPEFRIQPNRYLRFGIKGALSFKSNPDPELEQKATIYSGGIESRFNSPDRGSFFVDVQVSGIDYSGPNNTPSQVSMLEALRPGFNLVWSANWQYNLNKFLQLTLNYNGRKSEDIDAIHIGGVQVRAFF